jgi:glutamine synthetase
LEKVTGIRYIEFRFVDILGRLGAMIVPCKPVDDLELLKQDPILSKGTSLDGSSILGLTNVEESDLRLDPDPDTLIELPYYEQRTAAAMCFFRDRIKPKKEKKYHPLDSRGRLHYVCDKYLPGDKHLKVKVEPEFVLITPEGTPYDDGGYADTFPRNPSADILLEIATAIQKLGMRPRVMHHEVAQGQQEIELAFDDEKKMADYVTYFKTIARVIALKHGLDVCFMPKPFSDQSGNGLHCHLQLWDGDKNLFGAQHANELSEIGEMFVAGLLKHAPAITAIANPTVNSFKRLVPHHEAPVYITWGSRNRTALIRIPLFSAPEHAAIEFRSPDPMANPYLLFSALIAAGMHGINRGFKPPEPINENVFKFTDEQRNRLGIEILPKTLGEAIQALKQDTVIREALGLSLYEMFLTLKQEEWRHYIGSVITDFEWNEYHPI